MSAALKTHPQPVGVDTPKKQSPSTLDTTWSWKMGVLTTPALAREAHRATSNVVVFIFIFLFFSLLSSFAKVVRLDSNVV